MGALVGWLGQLVKEDGKQVQAAIDELVKDGLIIVHKKRRTVSLNPHRARDIQLLLNAFNL